MLKKSEPHHQFIEGKYPLKMLDFDVLKFFELNKYESIRLGIGVKLNEKFSKLFHPIFMWVMASKTIVGNTESV